MTAQQLQDFLHRCIPATAALHIRVVSCSADGVPPLPRCTSASFPAAQTAWRF